MNKSVRIIKAETVIRDGEMRLHYIVESNGKIKDFERPFYDNDGKVDPEVQNIIQIAQKHDEQCKNAEPEVEKTPVKNLVVYQEPQQNAKVSKNYKEVIVSGLAGVLAGALIASMLRSCGSIKNVEHENGDNQNAVIEQEDKIIYITEEKYHNGVKNLCEYLNSALGFNYTIKDMNAFYYLANMDIISSEVFTNLVKEGYLPDTDIKIVQSAFGITSDLKTKFGQDEKISIDFTKIFNNKEMIDICDTYSEHYNNMFSSTDEVNKGTAERTIDNLEKFIIEDPQSGYNTLPVGGKFISKRILFDLISIKAGEIGIAASNALNDEISDMTSVIKALQDSFNCSVVLETDKVLTK